MLRHLIDLFFPLVCFGCHRPLLRNEYLICTVCRHELPQTQYYRNPFNEAFYKFYGRIPVEHVSCFVYFRKKGIVQQLIHALKYRGQQEIGRVLGEWYTSDLQTVEIIDTIDYIIPVPLHPRKLRERGYNQVYSFGKALSALLDIPFDDTILFKKTYTKTQSKKRIAKRMQLIADSFEVRFEQRHHGKHFLLLDDVLTTGTTLESCGRQLLTIPETKLSIITIAMSRS